MANPSRSLAQADAARRNGRLGRGPVTPEGRAIAASNAIEHGLASRAALLPSERAEQYEMALHGWFNTLRPRSQGEGQIVAQVADLAFRKQRLAKLEERIVNTALERKLEQSEPARALSAARAGIQGIQGLASLAEHVTDSTDANQVAKLLPGMRSISELVSQVDLAAPVLAHLDSAIDALVLDAILEIGVEAFQGLAKAARGVEAALVAKIPDLEAAVEADRERLADDVLLGEGPEMVLLERHRSRLARAFEAELRALKAVRELVAPDGDEAGSLVPPIRVELRLVGRKDR
jgi:hypothetical protein